MNKIIRKTLLGVGFLGAALTPFTLIVSDVSGSVIEQNKDSINIDDTNLVKEKFMEDEKGYFFLSVSFTGINNSYITFNLSKQNHKDKIMDDFSIKMKQNNELIGLTYYFGGINDDVNFKSWTYRVSDFDKELKDFQVFINTNVSEFNEETGDYNDKEEVSIEFEFDLNQLSYNITNVGVETINESYLDLNDGEILINYDFPFYDDIYILLREEITNNVIDIKTISQFQEVNETKFEDVPSGVYSIDFFIKDKVGQFSDVDIDFFGDLYDNNLSVFPFKEYEFYNLGRYDGIKIGYDNDEELNSPIVNILNVNDIYSSEDSSSYDAIEVSYYSNNIDEQYDVNWKVIDENSVYIENNINILEEGNGTFVISKDELEILSGEDLTLIVEVENNSATLYSESFDLSNVSKISNNLFIKDVITDFDVLENQKVNLSTNVIYFDNKNFENISLEYELYNDKNELIDSGVSEDIYKIYIENLNQDQKYKLVLKTSCDNNTLIFEKNIYTPLIDEFEKPKVIVNVIEEDSGINFSITKDDKFNSIVDMRLTLYSIDNKILWSNFVEEWSIDIGKSKINTTNLISTNILSSSLKNRSGLVVGEIAYENDEGNIEILDESNVELNLVKIKGTDYNVSYDLNEGIVKEKYSDSFTTESQKTLILIIMLISGIVVISLSLGVYFVLKYKKQL